MSIWEQRKHLDLLKVRSLQKVLGWEVQLELDGLQPIILNPAVHFTINTSKDPVTTWAFANFTISTESFTWCKRISLARCRTTIQKSRILDIYTFLRVLTKGFGQVLIGSTKGFPHLILATDQGFSYPTNKTPMLVKSNHPQDGTRVVIWM
jgi:hypothetical protein